MENLGPTRVTVSENWSWRILDLETVPDGATNGSEAAFIEELLDPPSKRARLTVRGPGAALETTTVEGKVRTTVTRTGDEAGGGVATYRRYVALTPPTGLPLPLWAGSAFSGEQGYSELLAPLGLEDFAPQSSAGSSGTKAAGYRLGDGNLYLEWQRSGAELPEEGEMKPTLVKWRLTLGPDLLPQHLEIEALVEVEGIKIENHGVLDYTFASYRPLTAEEVSLEPPDDWSSKSLTFELPLDLPYCDQAKWGQYWLGSRLPSATADSEALVLSQAEFIRFAYRDLSQRPQVNENDDYVRLLYAPLESGRDAFSAPVSETLEVQTRSPSSALAKDQREYAEQRVAAGEWKRSEATLAGTKATIYFGSWDSVREGEAPPRFDELYVSLPDAWVEIRLGPVTDPEEAISAFSRLLSPGTEALSDLGGEARAP